MKTFVRVVGEVIPGNRNGEEHKILCLEGLSSFIPIKKIEMIKIYTSMEDGIDYDIGGGLFDRLMFESGFCKNKDKHMQAWSVETHDRSDNCDCDYLADGPVFVVVVSGKQYVVHPNEDYFKKMLF